jgi:hypothetical protein
MAGESTPVLVAVSGSNRIGCGAFLFHVDLLAAGWESPCQYLVAADSLELAYEFAIAENSEYSRKEFDNGCSGYEIGKIVIQSC